MPKDYSWPTNLDLLSYHSEGDQSVNPPTWLPNWLIYESTRALPRTPLVPSDYRLGISWLCSTLEPVSRPMHHCMSSLTYSSRRIWSAQRPRRQQLASIQTGALPLSHRWDNLHWSRCAHTTGRYHTAVILKIVIHHRNVSYPVTRTRTVQYDFVFLLWHTVSLLLYGYFHSPTTTRATHRRQLMILTMG